jgi:hypothetical protein
MDGAIIGLLGVVMAMTGVSVGLCIRVQSLLVKVLKRLDGPAGSGG